MFDYLRIIGDVHGKKTSYLDLLDCEYSLQIGDMAFNYDFLAKVDPERHRFFKGNHDSYLEANPPHCLGDFGTHNLGGLDFFFCRGAFSIDKEDRTAGLNWWYNEQLRWHRLEQMIKLYEDTRPDIMITHTCPQSIARLIGHPQVLINYGFDPHTFTTDTQQALESCFYAHQPKVWIYGHFHQSRIDRIGNTTFICLNELDYLEVSADHKIKVTLSDLSR